ncbi:MAG TPA: hypothetical protein VLZ33_04760 [Dysgonamonadaceae bacterium]|nr:hypothetical protein [Dysgonamonadaceae bacterium]
MSEVEMWKSARAAKQLIIGEAEGFGILLHIVANSSDDFNIALTEFAKIPEVKLLL